MSSRIGNLRVNLGLDSSDFQAGLRNSQVSMKKFARVAAGIAAGVAAAGTAIVAIAKRSGAAVDAQAKLAQSLGTTVGSMQNLERAGELAGVSMQGIEQATKDLTRRLSQAAAGTGPAVDALEELGLNASELMALPLDERIVAINEAINKFVPAAERAAMAGRLFGEEGSIAAMRLQPDVIRQAADEIDRLGLRISEVDADRIELANDQLSGLAQVSKALGQQIALEVLPALGRMAASLTQAFEQGKPLRAVFDALVNNLATVARYAASAATVFSGKLVASLLAARGVTLSLTGAMVGLRVAMAAIPQMLAIIALAEGIKAFGGLIEKARELDSTMASLKEAQQSYADALAEFNASPSATARDNAIKMAKANLQEAQSWLEKTEARLEYLDSFRNENVVAMPGVDPATIPYADGNGAYIQETRTRAEELRATITSLNSDLAALESGATSVGGPMNDLGSTAAESAEATNYYTQALEQLRESVAAIGASGAPAAQSMAELSEQYGYLADEVNAAAEAQRALAEFQALQDSRSLAANMITMLGTFKDANESVEDLRLALYRVFAAQGPEQAAEAWGGLVAAIDEGGTSVDRMSEGLREIYLGAAQSTQQFASMAQASGAVSGQVANATNWTNSLAAAASGAYRNLAAAGGGARNLAAGIAGAYNAAANLLSMLNAVARTLGSVGSGLSRLSSSIAGPLASLGQATGAAGGILGNVLGNAAEWSGLSNFASKIGDAGRAMNGLMVETVGAAVAADQLALAMPGGGGGGGSGGGSGGKGGSGGGSIAAQATEAQKALASLREEHQKLQATVAMTAQQERIWEETQKLGANATAAQKAEVENLVPAIERLKAAKERLTEISRTAKEGFRDMFTGAITGAKSLGESLKNLLNKMVDMLANQAFDMLWGAGQNAMGGMFGGGGLSSMFGSLFGGFRAAGGPVSTSKGYIVGERGPEWFQPNTAGKIIPNGATSGPANMNVTIDLRGTSGDDALDRKIRAAAQETLSRVPGVMADHNLRIA